jgi:hypothetical protein
VGLIEWLLTNVATSDGNRDDITIVAVDLATE